MSNGQLVALTGDCQATIEICHSCQGRHVGIQCRPYRSDNPPFTHWYECPEHGDPVPLAIFQTGNVRTDLHNRVLKDIYEMQGKPHAVAVFSFNGDGHSSCRVHTSNFPYHAMTPSVDQLRAAFDRLRPPDQVDHGPLPDAPKDRLKLFGMPELAGIPAVVAEAVNVVEHVGTENQNADLGEGEAGE